MKYHIGFLGILATVLAGLAYGALNLSERHVFLFHENETLEAHLAEFRKHQSPRMELNFSELYGGGQFQILHPLLDARKARIKEPPPSCMPSDGQVTSPRLLPAQIPGLDDEGLVREQKQKEIVLASFAAGIMKLPADFLTTPPFVDHNGRSFALKLVLHGIEPYNDVNWVVQHLSFFKVSELERILEKYRIRHPQFALLSRFASGELEETIRGASVVLTSDHLLLKNESRLGFSPLSYWVYDRKDLATFLKAGSYELETFEAGAVCLEKVGNACWTYSSRHTLGFLYRSSQVVLIFLGLVFAGLLLFYLKYLYEKSREQKKHRLSLQVLSHEFRTPVSSLILLLESLRKDQDRFSIADQDLLTRASSEVFRLQRIIEVSQTYLQAEGRRIPFQEVEIASLNAWIGDFVSETGLLIESIPLACDRGITADPFWLKFVVSTLVQNAFAHGQAPVRIRLSARGDRVQITVEDEGECEFDSLKQMSDAFVKSPRSKGMGLGLNIARFIVSEWGSEIQFSKRPTAFTLSLVERKA